MSWRGAVATVGRMLRTLAIVLILAGVAAQPASASWLAPAEVSAGSAPSLAVARDGTAFAAFEHFDGANTRVAVAQRLPGGGFGPARDLSLPGRDAFSPAIAVDRQGNATLAWMQGPAFAVHTRSRPAGGDWGEVSPPLAPVTISAGPALAVGDNGAAVVAWSRDMKVEGATRRAGADAFDAPVRISVGSGTGICQAPRVAMDAAGNAAAIWTRRTSATGDYHVESSLKAAGATSWGAFEPRSLTAGNSDCNTDIVMTPDGRTTAVWDFTETGKPSFVAIEDHGPGGWSGARKLSAPATRSIRPVLGGENTVAWMAGGQVVASARPFSSSKPLSGATELSGLAVAGEQTVFVGTSNGSDALFASRALEDVVPVALTTPGVVLGSPDVALDDEGNAFAVWVRREGAASSVQVAAFDAVAPVLGAVDVPGAAVAGQPVSMSSSATDRTSAPALHVDFGDGSGADGATVSHVYAAPGAYTVTVTAADAAGNATSATRPIQVAPAPIVSGGGGGPGAPGRVFAQVSGSWDRLANGRTRMLELAVSELEGPETVRLACTGRGCRKRASRTVTRHGRKLDFSKYVHGMVLQPKAKLTVTATRPGFVGRITTYTMVRGRNPKKRVQCLAPGAKRAHAC